MRLFAGGNTFEIGLRVRGALARVENSFHGSDYSEPCATVMLPEEN